jgi:hypothetical protein
MQTIIHYYLQCKRVGINSEKENWYLYAIIFPTNSEIKFVNLTMGSNIQRDAIVPLWVITGLLVALAAVDARVSSRYRLVTVNKRQKKVVPVPN